ncbi:hypothetical protein [Pantoea stewartii]|uniref:hypothetical protein n=1 Tax=Pantoea stewartii TaxID=66269 RepID=UPI0025A2AB80|nr:hypothetical protein [Pantoea stewartii]
MPGFARVTRRAMHEEAEKSLKAGRVDHGGTLRKLKFNPTVIAYLEFVTCAAAGVGENGRYRLVTEPAAGAE